MWTCNHLKWKIICIICCSVTIGMCITYSSLLLAFGKTISALTCGIITLMLIGLDWILVNEFSWYMKHFTKEYLETTDKIDW